ncbi:MAG: molybdopterin-binding protein [Hyphomonadaceae bacterium]|nr:molybdopterin-binding protein [Hyphomonadaceae bacterium]
MKFGTLRVSDAEGAILAHTMRGATSLVRKGTALTLDDLADLRACGVERVMVARLEPGDVGEDDAAARVALRIAGKGSSVGRACTGRANIFAYASGVAVIDRAGLRTVNGLDEGLTVASLPPFARVHAGQMLATVKIIPFALPESVVSAAELACSSKRSGLVDVAPFSPHRAGLVLTRSGAEKPGLLEKRLFAVRSRLTGLGCDLVETETVAHETECIRDALLQLARRELDPLLVFGASAIVDRADVVPAAIETAGGSVVHVGMPVDPGNLLLYGRLGQATVIGVPSCASSPKLNGFDWVLERCLAGIAVDREQIVEMAVGGLLIDVGVRPAPHVA